MPLVEKPRLVPEEFLALLELLLFFVEPADEGPELALPPEDIRFPLFELPERFLARLEFASERFHPAAERRLPRFELVLLHPQDVPVCVLHVDEALFELQDVLLLEQEVLDLALQVLPLPDVLRIRRGFERLDAAPSPLDQRVHLLEAPLPPVDHPVERLGELPERLVQGAARLEVGIRLGDGRGIASCFGGSRGGAPSLRPFPAELEDPSEVLFLGRTGSRLNRRSDGGERTRFRE